MMENSKGVPSSGNSMAQVEYFDDESKIFHSQTYNIKNNNKQVDQLIQYICILF